MIRFVESKPKQQVDTSSNMEIFEALRLMMAQVMMGTNKLQRKNPKASVFHGLKSMDKIRGAFQMFQYGPHLSFAST